MKDKIKNKIKEIEHFRYLMFNGLSDLYNYLTIELKNVINRPDVEIELRCDSGGDFYFIELAILDYNGSDPSNILQEEFLKLESYLNNKFHFIIYNEKDYKKHE